ncbi:acyl carrier protein [Acetilactobacillus jinshanensis]|uniref:Acyl carrier protein n=1 Tax=Acetilactobacillus jinshanensis TaxID=1720083 RepID=A0A4P6ZLD2_9LACO|nr:acyl carrier protein [Acetilactobacillus jinshanensis]QBP18616.1 acyl carrier protein [Acetilactobacillus jinshanensis]URL61492.1 acyl carrier protein [uncultured bacterium]
MDKKTIFNQVAAVIAKQFDIDQSKIKGSLNFKNDLDADSIDLIEVVMSLENKFNAKIPDTEAQKLQTVDDVVNYISAHHQN